ADAVDDRRQHEGTGSTGEQQLTERGAGLRTLRARRHRRSVPGTFRNWIDRPGGPGRSKPTSGVMRSCLRVPSATLAQGEAGTEGEAQSTEDHGERGAATG